MLKALDVSIVRLIAFDIIEIVTLEAFQLYLKGTSFMVDLGVILMKEIIGRLEMGQSKCIRTDLQ